MINRSFVTKYRQRLNEGGAVGHMNHPFEDFDLTFGDLKSMIELGLSGQLNVEAPVTEKLDGQNISVSYKNERGVVFARNKEHLKDRGSNALDVRGIEQMFAGRGDLTDAFVFAAQDLESAITKLSSNQLKNMFADGSRWMNIEIIYPKTQNVVPYGLNMLVFHNALEVDDTGTVIGTGDDDGKILANMIKQINQEVQNTFTFQGPVVVSLPKSKDFSRKKTRFFNEINKLQRQFRLTDADKIIMWHQMWWEKFIDSHAARLKYAITNTVRQGLLRRWAFSERGVFSIVDLKRGVFDQNPKPNAQKFLEWAIAFDKNDMQKQFKDNIAPFELIFLRLGAEILQNVRGLVSVSPGNAAESLRKELDKTVAELSRTSDVKKLDKFKQQLQKLNAIGTDKLVPTEGIVFMFKGKIYKLTGTFAPLGQIMGLLKFG